MRSSQLQHIAPQKANFTEFFILKISAFHIESAHLFCRFYIFLKRNYFKQLKLTQTILSNQVLPSQASFCTGTQPGGTRQLIRKN